MTTRTRTSLGMLAIVCLCLTANLRAHDLVPPDFRGLPATVFAEFVFGAAANPVGAAQGNWVPGPAGEPLFPGKTPEVSFEDGVFVWNENNGGYWTASENGELQICMPNIVDDFPAKYIRVQVTWSYNGPSDPPFLTGIIGTDAEDGPLSDVKIVRKATRPIGGNARQTVIDIRVEPNPDWEVLRLGVPAGMNIHQIVMDTISVPKSQHSGADEIEVPHGIPVLGTWQDTLESDDKYFGVQLTRHPAPPISNRPGFQHADVLPRPEATLLARSFWMPKDNEVLVALALRIEARGTMPGLIQTVELFNWTTYEFDTIGSATLTMEDVVYEYELLNFADYVEPTTGETRAKVYTQATRHGIRLPNTVLDWIDFKRELDLYEE